MLQVRFTAQDLLNVRFAPRPAPLMELGLAAASLQRRDRPEVFARWRAERRRSLPTAALPLFSLVPPNGAGPLFLDPLTEALDESLDAVLSTGRDTARSELDRVCPAYRPVTSWVRDLADRDPRAWRTLEHAVRAGHRALVDPVWERMRASYAADVAWRSHLLAARGVGAVLASLYPGSDWAGTTLRIPRPGSVAVVALTGEGVTLMPSSVWTGDPLIGRDDDGRRLFLYPALTPFPRAAEAAGDPLAALLGRTRAAVLRALTVQRTTGDLARELAVSLASASEHTGTLRAAGLVVSGRDGKSVWHLVTPLGADLLAGPSGP